MIKKKFVLFLLFLLLLSVIFVVSSPWIIPVPPNTYTGFSNQPIIFYYNNSIFVLEKTIDNNFLIWNATNVSSFTPSDGTLFYNISVNGLGGTGSMIVLPNSNIVVIFRTENNSNYYYEEWVKILTQNASVVADFLHLNYTDSYSTYSYPSLCADNSSNFYVNEIIFLHTSGLANIFITKYNASGTMLWNSSLGYASYGMDTGTTSCIVDSDSQNILVAAMEPIGVNVHSLVLYNVNASSGGVISKTITGIRGGDYRMPVFTYSTDGTLFLSWVSHISSPKGVYVGRVNKSTLNVTILINHSSYGVSGAGVASVASTNMSDSILIVHDSNSSSSIETVLEGWFVKSNGTEYFWKNISVYTSYAYPQFPNSFVPSEAYARKPYYLVYNNYTDVVNSRMIVLNFDLAEAINYTNVLGCFNITSNGTYVLTGDVNGNQASGCVYINSSNVLLDCNGHLIYDSDLPESKGIFVNNVDNVTIRNCFVRDYYYGFYLNSSKNVILINNTVFSNNHTGCYVLSSNFVQYLNNNFSSNNFYGAYLISSFYNNFSGNYFVSNFNKGINNYASFNNSFVNNSFVLNTNEGGYVSFSNNVYFGFNNFSSNNEGFKLQSSYNCSVINNTFNSNNYNIYLSSSNYNNILQNTVVNGTYGVYLYGSHNNSVFDNSINLTLYSTFLTISQSNNISSNKLFSNAYGVYSSNSLNNSYTYNNVSSNTNYGFYFYSSSNNTVSYNLLSSNNYGLLLYASCFNNLISFNNIFNSNSYGVWLDNGVFYNVIKSNNISGGSINIYFTASSSNNSVLDNKIFNSGSGIIFVNAFNNSIVNNTCINNSNNGIYLHTSSNNRLVYNNVSLNKEGVYLISSQNNSISNNVVYSNSEGIWVSGDSRNNLVYNNSLWSNSNSLYLDSSSSNNTFVSNKIFSSSCGAYISSFFNNIFYDNFFNNTVNININNLTNYWNTSKTSGVNIVGGNFLGGNFWAKPSGNGFSENMTLCNPGLDGFCQNPYVLGLNNTDYLPLTVLSPDFPIVSFVTPTPSSGSILNVSYFGVNVTASTGSDLVNITVYLYNSSGLVSLNYSNSSPFYTVFSLLGSGVYYINASALNSLGNTGFSNTISVILNTPSTSTSSSGGGGSDGEGIFYNTTSIYPAGHYCFDYDNGTSVCLDCFDGNVVVGSDGVPYCVKCSDGFVLNSNGECVLSLSRMSFFDNDTFSKINDYVTDYVPGGWLSLLVILLVTMLLYLGFRD